MAQKCNLCKKNVSSVSLEECSVCEERVCRDCLCTCVGCEAPLCESCAYFCESCGEAMCPDCAIVSAEEYRPHIYCEECHEEMLDRQEEPEKKPKKQSGKARKQVKK